MDAGKLIWWGMMSVMEGRRADIYVTGSNSKLMSSEISTYLTCPKMIDTNMCIIPLVFHILPIQHKYGKYVESRRNFIYESHRNCTPHR